PLAMLCAGLGFYLVKARPWVAHGSARPGVEEKAAAEFCPVSVPVNRGPEVQDGFRGDIHPLLHGHTRLRATADPLAGDLERLLFGPPLRVPEEVFAVFENQKPVAERRTLTERELSAFLPEKVGAVGQAWSLDPDKVAAVLSQFHPR